MGFSTGNKLQSVSLHRPPLSPVIQKAVHNPCYIPGSAQMPNLNSNSPKRFKRRPPNSEPNPTTPVEPLDRVASRLNAGWQHAYVQGVIARKPHGSQRNGGFSPDRHGLEHQSKPDKSSTNRSHTPRVTLNSSSQHPVSNEAYHKADLPRTRNGSTLVSLGSVRQVNAENPSHPQTQPDEASVQYSHSTTF